MSDDFEQQFADILQEEINKEVIVDIKVAALVANGWHLITIDNSVDFGNVGQWMQENIRHNWRLFSGRAVFENENDAVLFKMTWC